MKKVLFITHPESDYGGAFLYDGLRHLLGYTNVIDYPEKKSYHGVVHTYSIRDIPNGVTGPLPWQFPLPYPLAHVPENETENVVKDMLRNGEFCIVVMESGRYCAVDAYNILQNEIKNAGIPVVMHDGEDGDHFHSAAEQIHPHVLLKRELTWGKYEREDFTMHDGMRVVAFPFSAPIPEMNAIIAQYNNGKPSTLARTCDLLLACGITWPERRNLAHGLHSASSGQSNDPSSYDSVIATSDTTDTDGIGMQTLFNWPDYVVQMHKAKMTVSMRGWGWDTVRYWEAAYLSVLLCDRVQFYIPNPLQENVHCLCYNDINHAIQLAKDWHTRDAELIEMQRRSREHITQYHSNEARARRMFEVAGVNYNA